MIIKDYRLGLAIVFILILASISLLVFKGIPKSIDITGGAEITIKVKDPNIFYNLRSYLSGLAEVKELKSSSGYYIVVRCSYDKVEIVKKKLKEFFKVESLSSLNYSEKTVGPILSSRFFEEGFKALAFAFIFMSLVVYFYFRDPYPSGAIILSALTDIILTLGAMSLFNIELSTATIAALLMIIGYSVDSDILLTTKVLRRLSVKFDESVKEAFETGITMTLTTIAAMVTLLIVVKLFIPIADILANIAEVLVIALVADIISTWILNVSLLKLYLKKIKKVI